MRIGIALVAALLIAPAAIAQDQVPIDPTVQVTIEAVVDGASLDAPATYTVTVRNTSPASGSDQDPPMNIALTVTSDTPGWTASLQKSTFQIPAGGSESTTLAVAVSGSATSDRTTVTVDATITSGSPPLARTGTDSESVDVLREDSTRRAVTETIGDYLWFIIGGGILLYIVSTALLVALFRKRDQDQSGKGEQ